LLLLDCFTRFLRMISPRSHEYNHLLLFSLNLTTCCLSFQRTNKFLSTRAYQICDIEDGNSPSLTSNVRLLRQEMALGLRNQPRNHPPSGWDHNVVRQRTNIGGFVKSAASATTVKRNTTLLDHN
jgi:hypothetical protein